MNETAIVYSLVLLFFLILVAFVRAVLFSHPYAEPASSKHSENGVLAGEKGTGGISVALAYVLLAFFFVGVLIVTVLNQRSQR